MQWEKLRQTFIDTEESLKDSGTGSTRCLWDWVLWGGSRAQMRRIPAEGVSQLEPLTTLSPHPTSCNLEELQYTDWVLNAETPGLLTSLGSETLATRPSPSRYIFKFFWEIWSAQEERLTYRQWSQRSQQTAQPRHSTPALEWTSVTH